MKNSSVAAACLALCGVAQAQSNVNIYGIIDTGVSHVSNIGGRSNTTLATGVLSPNLIGFTGKEDLGGGVSAVFKLENQFAADDGQSLGGLFSHQAYVGVQSEQWGAVKAGIQSDFMFTELALKRYGPMFRFISLQNLRQGPFNALGIPNVPGGSFDFDRVGDAQHLANSVRYDSPALGNLTFGMLYAFGEQPGGGSRSGAKSAGASYSAGALSLNAAYTDVKYASINGGRDGIRSWGAGGRYDVGSGVSLDALYTNTKNTMSGAEIDAFEAGALFPVSTALNFVAAYTYMKGNAALSDNKAHQYNLTLHQTLSKRTALYVAAVYQKADGGASAKAWLPIAGGESSTGTQSIFRLGLQHGF